MRLLEQLTVVARRLRLAPSTISVYVSWVRQFLTFIAAAHGTWKHPAQLGSADVEAFLNDLVLRRRLSASAQNQALCALVFLYGKVLEDVIPQQHLGEFLLQRSRRPKRVPTVLSAGEVQRLIAVIPENSKYRLPIDRVSPAIPSVTASPPICWRWDTTFGRCSSSWGIRRSRRR